MVRSDDDFTPEELHLAQRLFEERLRQASQERYRRLVETNDPSLARGPVKVPRDEERQLREAVAAEVRARRGAVPAPPRARRWPWQRP